MIKPLDGGVTLCTFETLGTLFPADTFLEDLAIFRRVLKYFGGSSKISHVVCINATFTVVRVFLRWTPSGFVHEHVEYKSILIKIKTLQVVIQVGTVE